MESINLICLQTIQLSCNHTNHPLVQRQNHSFGVIQKVLRCYFQLLQVLYILLHGIIGIAPTLLYLYNIISPIHKNHEQL